MATALVSRITGRPVRSDVGMTGEITLRGLVLPIGGLKEKVLAAHRAGLKVVIHPRRNEKDLDDVPEEVRRELKFVPVDRVEDVLAVAFEPQPSNGARRTTVRRRRPAAKAAGRKTAAPR
jgi:ATP-dependent Lon protease